MPSSIFLLTARRAPTHYDCPAVCDDVQRFDVRRVGRLVAATAVLVIAAGVAAA